MQPSEKTKLHWGWLYKMNFISNHSHKRRVNCLRVGKDGVERDLPQESFLKYYFKTPSSNSKIFKHFKRFSRTFQAWNFFWCFNSGQQYTFNSARSDIWIAGTFFWKGWNFARGFPDITGLRVTWLKIGDRKVACYDGNWRGALKIEIWSPDWLLQLRYSYKFPVVSHSLQWIPTTNVRFWIITWPGYTKTSIPVLNTSQHWC